MAAKWAARAVRSSSRLGRPAPAPRAAGSARHFGSCVEGQAPQPSHPRRARADDFSGPVVLGSAAAAVLSSLLSSSSDVCCETSPSASSTKSLNEEPESESLRKLFDRMADGEKIELDNFVRMCQDELQINLSKVELTRLFNRMDADQSGGITYEEFRRGIRRSFLFKAIASNLMDETTSPPRVGEYDYAVPTYVAHRHPEYLADSPFKTGTSTWTTYSLERHGHVVGDFSDIRRNIDYAYHVNYDVPRQLWQDRLLRRVALCQPPQERPWLIFTCGAMGAGKGHVMEWLSKNGIFPLEDIVHIDPDYFKSVMPEWSGYTQNNKMQAGSMCHKESGFLQELAQEAAMRNSQNIWIDGSLRDYVWYTHIFRDVRQRFSKYRIALIYVHCSPGEMLRRIRKRGKKTGRWIEEKQALAVANDVRFAIDVLGPQADFVAYIENEGTTPYLEKVVHNQCHSFSSIKMTLDISQKMHFPEALRALSVERDQFLTEQLQFPTSMEVLKRHTEAGDRYMLADVPENHASEQQAVPYGGHTRYDRQQGMSQTALDSLGTEAASFIARAKSDNEDAFVQRRENVVSHLLANHRHNPRLFKWIENLLPLKQRKDRPNDMLWLPLKPACKPLLKSMVEGVEDAHLVISAPTRVNLDDHSRQVANIPESAVYFCLSYGAVKKDGTFFIGEEVCEEAAALLGKWSLLYFDWQCQIVGVNVVSQDCTAEKRHFLRCETAVALPPRMVAKLDGSQRWCHRVPLVHASGKAQALAWILPHELRECPFGAFAFHLRDGSYIYFPVSTGQ